MPCCIIISNLHLTHNHTHPDSGWSIWQQLCRKPTSSFSKPRPYNRVLPSLWGTEQRSWPIINCSRGELGCLFVFFFTVIILRVSRLSTILSRATAHGGLQLKCQKLGVASYLEELLKWFNFPHTKAHPGCEVSCQGIPNLPASSLRPCFIKARPAVEKAVLCYKAD